MMKKALPHGFRGVTANLGIKPIDDDFVTVVSAVPARSAVIFTRSRFAGPCVALSRASALARSSRGVAVLAGNANVATGCLGAQHAAEVRTRVAKFASVPARDLIICSTGAIGRPYPMDAIRRGLDRLSGPFNRLDVEAAASAMMTGDTQPKSVHVRCGNATLVGIAKGGGVTEHDRATILVFFFTDADLPADDLERVFQGVMGRTFSALGVEADTATSDTVALFANGLAGQVKMTEFERVLQAAALELARQIASEDERASMRFEVECPDGLTRGSSI
jgi:glutamate N-acetyltransferase/amino-acid N-acetyltransferase